MNDPMQEMVCPKCGNGSRLARSCQVPSMRPQPVWECYGCEWTGYALETRAEYLAALEDQGREDR